MIISEWYNALNSDIINHFTDVILSGQRFGEQLILFFVFGYNFHSYIILQGEWWIKELPARCQIFFISLYINIFQVLLYYFNLTRKKSHQKKVWNSQNYGNGVSKKRHNRNSIVLWVKKRMKKIKVSSWKINKIDKTYCYIFIFDYHNLYSNEIECVKKRNIPWLRVIWKKSVELSLKRQFN